MLNQLNRAIRIGDFAHARSLIEPGQWLNDKDADRGDTALCAAVTAKAHGLVNALLEAGANVEARSRHGETPLHRACQLGFEEIARALIDAGADVSAKTTSDPSNIESGHTVLMKAVDGGNLSLVKLLVEKGADLGARDDFGFSCLRYAQNGRRRIADYLAKMIAAAADKMEISVYEAVRARALSRLIALASQGVPLDEPENDADRIPIGGLTPLHLAASGAWLAGVEFLLGRGVPADVRCRHHMTPLMYVGAGKEALAVVRALLQAGADVNAQSQRGASALGQASEVDLVQLLLGAGADPNLRNPGSGGTVFLDACMMTGPDILAAMIDAGADLNAVDNSGRGVEFYSKSSFRARALINERLGAAMTRADRIRETLKSLPKLAKNEAFISYSEKLGAAFNRKPAPWTRCKGALYFHDVSVSRVYTYLNQAMPDSEDRSVHGEVLARLAVDARQAGGTLFHLGQAGDRGRKPIVLLPIAEPLAPAICCGTNGNLYGDTNHIVDALLKISDDDPFDIYGCGFDFVDAQLRGPPKDAHVLAERLIKVCPELAEFDDRPGSVLSIAAELARTGRFGLWWD